MFHFPIPIILNPYPRFVLFCMFTLWDEVGHQRIPTPQVNNMFGYGRVQLCMEATTGLFNVPTFGKWILVDSWNWIHHNIQKH